MSKTRREIQEQLQKDEVAETLQQIATNIQEKRSLLITIGIVLLLGIVSIMVVRSYRQRVLSESNAKLTAAFDRYRMLVGQPDAAQQKTALKETVDAADQLASSHSGTKLGLEALYIKGNAYYYANDFANAQKAYQAYIEKAGTTSEKAKGYIALGYAFENEAFLSPKNQQVEKLNTALTHYVRAAEIAKTEEPYLYYYALLCQARVHELKPGEEPKAVAIYKQIIAERPVPVPPTKEERPGAEDSLQQLIRKQIEQAEGQMSFQATAQLRLDRLQATPEGGPAAVTTEVKATPAPAAKPEAAPAATATPAPTVAPATAPAATPAATPAPTATPEATPAPTSTPPPAAAATTQTAPAQP